MDYTTNYYIKLLTDKMAKSMCFLDPNFVSIMNMIFTIFLILLVINLNNYLLYLGQDNEVLNYTFPYLDLICISLIPLILFQTFKQFIEGLGFTKLAFW